MKTKIVFLTLILTIGFTFQNCCNCPEIDGEFFDIRDMEVIHQDSRGFFTDLEELSFNEYGFLALIFEVDYIAFQECMHWNFSTMSSAYGCDCTVNGTSGSRDEMIQNLDVITVNDYNEDYAAGDTINELINVFTFGEEIDLNTYVESVVENIQETSLRMTLDEVPTMNNEFQVRIRMDLSTGERYDVISRAISFQ